MNILIAGGTGFVGRALVRALLAHGYHVIVLGRSRSKIEFMFEDISIEVWSWIDLESAVKPIDIVINLAGENIFSWWTRAKKNKIADSRLAATKRLIAFCMRQKEENGFAIRFFQASGVGVYGIRGDRIYDEETPQPQACDFLSELALRVEGMANEAENHGIPVTIMRFGIVLDPNGGFLEHLFPFFKYGLGAIFGGGRQYLSWITRVDLVRAILFLIDHPALVGPFNMVAKEPLSQAEFALRYARYLGRPLFIRFPAPLVGFLMGEMGRELVLGGQNVVPKKLLAAGFEYDYPNLAYYFSKPIPSST